MILEQIAQPIAEKTKDIIGYPITLTDEKGHIIGSTDRNRLGTFHRVSSDVLKKGQPICYRPDEVKDLENVLPGVATPIVFNNKAIGVLGIVGDPDEVKKYAQLVKSHVEMMCQESFKLEMNVLESKTLDTLIQYLLHYDNKEESKHIIRYGHMLGYDLAVDRVCIIIDIDSLSINLSNQNSQFSDKFSLHYLQQELMENVKYVFIDNKQDMISYLNLEQFIILKSVQSKEKYDFNKTIEHKLQKLNQYLKRKFDLTAAVAIGDLRKGVEGIKESFQNAIKALMAGKKANLMPKIYQYNDWNITLELLSRELTPYLTDKLLHSVSDFINYDNFPTLSSTFMTYCKCSMNLSETARTLFIHRNSLVYRLEKIGELTSLDMANFEQCLLLYIAVKNYDNNRAQDI